MHERIINPTDGVYPATPDYVHALEVEGASRQLFVSGTMGLDVSGEPPETIDEQLHLIWNNNTQHSWCCRYDNRRYRPGHELSDQARICREKPECPAESIGRAESSDNSDCRADAFTELAGRDRSDCRHLKMFRQ